MGGHKIVIHGHGFNEVPGMTKVTICDMPCHPTAEATPSSLECATSTYWLRSAPRSLHSTLTVMPHQVKGSGTAADQISFPASKMFDGQVGVDHEWRCAPDTCFSLFAHQTVVNCGQWAEHVKKEAENHTMPSYEPFLDMKFLYVFVIVASWCLPSTESGK